MTNFEYLKKIAFGDYLGEKIFLPIGFYNGNHNFGYLKYTFIYEPYDCKAYINNFFINPDRTAIINHILRTTASVNYFACLLSEENILRAIKFINRTKRFNWFTMQFILAFLSAIETLRLDINKYKGTTLLLTKAEENLNMHINHFPNNFIYEIIKEYFGSKNVINSEVRDLLVAYAALHKLEE